MHAAPPHFSAPWGRTLKLVTAGASLILLGFAGMGLLFMAAAPPWARGLVIVLPLAVLLGAPPFMVLGYTLDRGQLLIVRPGWRVRIPLRGLREVCDDREALRGSVRLFGNGGLFAFTGWFWNRRLGRYRAFVTDVNRAVVLRWPDRVVVVSPDDPQRFAHEALAHATLT